MRLLRLRVKDFRGVAEHDVRLLPTGVTVIQGPNEVGKSSLAEALDLLLFEQVTTTKRTVRAVRPRGRDIGSEVEAELEVGEVALRYFKRFFRQTETVLTELAPRHRETIGREAHERALALLAERCDLDLWRALRVAQGEGWHQAELAGRASLLAALAGGVRDGATEPGPILEDLFDRVRAECARYHTTGRWQPTGELRERAAAVAEREATLAHVQTRLDALQDDVERAAALQDRVAALEEDLAAAEADAAAALARLEAVSALQAEVDAAAVALRDAGRRTTLLEQYAAARGQEVTLAEAAAAAADGVLAAEAAVPEAHADLDAAAGHCASAARVREAVQAQQLRDRDMQELERLRERYDRARTMTAALASARARRAGNDLDDRALAELEELDSAVTRAEAAAAAGRPRVEVRALAAATVEVDGAPHALLSGEVRDVAVAAAATVEVPGLVRLTVRAGADSAELEAAVVAARRAFSSACEAAGVADLAAARRRHAERASADQTAAEAVVGLAALGLQPPDGASPDAVLAPLDDAVRRAEATVRDRGDADPRVDAEARERIDRLGAAGAMAEAAAAVEAAEAERGAAAARLAAVTAAVADARGLVARLDVEAAGLQRSLADLRRRLADEGIDAAGLADADHAAVVVSEATRARDAARARQAAAHAALADARAEEAAAAAEAASRRLTSVTADLDRAEGDLREVRGALSAREEDGLFERAERERAALARARAELERVQARAAAARLLHETMQAARDEARVGYLEPLRRQIVELGRHLYGERFDVELDDDLRIATRTVDGTTVDFADLSLGAREQLSLLTRLACGLLVSDEGGVPLILDDTLGSSDEERLKRMAEVLSIAGERCQVIVLTCVPGRFAGIHGARTITLV